MKTTFNIEFTAVTAKGKKVRGRLVFDAMDKYAAQDRVLHIMTEKHGVLYYPVFKFGAKKLHMTSLTEHVLVTNEHCDD